MIYMNYSLSWLPWFKLPTAPEPNIISHPFFSTDFIIKDNIISYSCLHLTILNRYANRKAYYNK